MSFLRGSLDFLTGKRSSHMGTYQYVDHAGMRGNVSMSGAKLWAEIEASELKASGSNLMSSDERLMQHVSSEIHAYLPEGLPVLEMGPGTVSAFGKKMLRVLMALRSIHYICVDESSAFLRELAMSPALAGFKVVPILDDFFEGRQCYFEEEDRPALVCLLGGTIGNMPSPVSDRRPKEALVNHLSLLAQRIHDGWLLVSYDANHDGEGIKEYYSHHTLFHLNVFDRMAVELPLEGDFDPCAFDYEPLWIPSSGQAAHMAVVLRDMTFSLGGRKIELKQGQRLHLKNSFKFPPAFFASCCAQAGLDVVKTWTDPSQTSVCLLRKRPQAMALPHQEQEAKIAVNF